MLVGSIVVLVGIVFLLNNLGLLPYISWNILWPVIVILVGLSMLERRSWWWGGPWDSPRHRWRRRYKDWDCEQDKKEEKGEEPQKPS
ncbi:MAG: hypothetical protein KGJ34_02795 [Patescibacteria group bacterium]|nr:hypothetical protein [Patescibacteria group bacterium]